MTLAPGSAGVTNLASVTSPAFDESQAGADAAGQVTLRLLGAVRVAIATLTY